MLRIGPINAATPTPLTAEGCFDRNSARRLAKRWLDIGLDGVLVLGSMGEGLCLSDDVRHAFIETALAEAGDRITIFASAADLSLQRMRERAIRYAGMGVPCVVLCLPPGVAPAKAVADVKAVADCCPVPCCYYEIPANTGTALPLDDILDILSHPNIRAMKDSSNSALIAQALTYEGYRPPGVFLLDGVEYRAAFSHALGYDGVLHGGGALTGRRVRAIWQAAAEGDWNKALALDRENSLFLGAVYNRFSRPLQTVIGQKYALGLLDIFAGNTVLIDQSLDDSARARITKAVEENGEWL